MLYKNLFTIKNILFFVLSVAFLYFIAQIKDVALLFFGSYVIACSLNPIVDKMSKFIPRIWATTIVLLISASLVLAVFLPILAVTLREFRLILMELPKNLSALNTFLSHYSFQGYTFFDFVKLDNLGNVLNDVGKVAWNHSVDVTVGFLSFVAVLFSLIMIVFYLVFEKEEIRKGVLKLFPPKIRDEAGKIVATISERVGGYIIAQLASMTVVGIIVALGLALLNVKYAVFLGLLAAVTDIIPIVGPTLALVTGIIAAMPNGWIVVLATILVFMLAQWISNNFARPLVFGKFLNLHPMIIILAFLVAAKFLGVWGVILAPALAAVFVTLFDEIYVKMINQEQDDE